MKQNLDPFIIHHHKDIPRYKVLSGNIYGIIFHKSDADVKKLTTVTSQ
jgi:hypothetical protein